MWKLKNIFQTFENKSLCLQIKICAVKIIVYAVKIKVYAVKEKMIHGLEYEYLYRRKMMLPNRSDDVSVVYLEIDQVKNKYDKWRESRHIS